MSNNADVSQQSILALELAPRYFAPGRRGAAITPPGVTLGLIADEDRFNVEARRGKSAELIAAIAKAFGVSPIDRPVTVETDGVAFVGVGPARWHAISRGEGRAGRRVRLIEAARPLATVVDVSHGFVTFRLSGPKARDALAKLAHIDLDPASFAAGACAGAALHGVNVQLRRSPDGAAFECAAPRSFAASVYHALIRAADPYGLVVESLA